MRQLFAWGLAITGVLAYGYFTDAARDDSGVVVKAGESSVFELQKGDCIRDEVEGPTSGVGVAPCDEAHDYEVFATDELAGNSYPGDDDAGNEATSKCITHFEDYFGIAYLESQLDVTHFTPTEEGWNDAGDRGITCLAFRMDREPMTGRVRNY